MRRRITRTWAALAMAAVLPATGCQAVNAVLGADGPTAEVYVTSQAGDRITAHAPVTFTSDAATAPVTLTVDASQRYQTMVGFGASFLEAGLVTLDTLPTKAQQDAVLRALFDPDVGAGFSVMKTEMGSTDFMSATQDWFTYDDVPDDTDLTHFSIARDLLPTGEITFIRRARQVGGSFVLQSSMDYPPDWMLTTVDDKDHQNVDPQYYDVLARYYLRYLDAYARQGVHIDYVSLFNEPTVYTKIPAEDLDVLLRDHVGPLLRAKSPTTRFLVTEVPIRKYAISYYEPILDDPGARQYIDALAYHGYGDGGLDQVAALHARMPQTPLWMTEICCMHDPTVKNPGPTTYTDGDLWANQILDDLGAGASTWIYWNMILDETGGPWLVSPVHEDPDPNSQPAIVHIDATTHEVTYTALYYYLSHFSRFVRPGSVRIGTTLAGPGKVRAVAFQGPTGTVVTELVNSAGTDTTVRVQWQNHFVTVTLPARSITTLRWVSR